MPEREDDDIPPVLDLLKYEFNFVPSHIHCKRLNSVHAGGRPRLLQVFFQTKEDAAWLLSRASKLRNSRDRSIRDSIYINKNQSYQERHLAFIARQRRRGIETGASTSVNGANCPVRDQAPDINDIVSFPPLISFGQASDDILHRNKSLEPAMRSGVHPITSSSGSGVHPIDADQPDALHHSATLLSGVHPNTSALRSGVHPVNASLPDEQFTSLRVANQSAGQSTLFSPPVNDMQISLTSESGAHPINIDSSVRSSCLSVFAQPFDFDIAGGSVCKNSATDGRPTTCFKSS